jgi:hypothetical protein
MVFVYHAWEQLRTDWKQSIDQYVKPFTINNWVISKLVFVSVFTVQNVH